MVRPTRRRRRRRLLPLGRLVGLVALIGIVLLALNRQVASSSTPAASPSPVAQEDPTAEALLVDDSSLRWIGLPTPLGGDDEAAGATPPARRRTPTGPEPLPTPVQAPRAGPYSPIALVPDPDLGARVAQRLAGRSGRFGIALKDLDTGRGVLIDPDGEYEAASLFKLPVMYEVYKQRELGAVSFDETLVLTERHVAYDLGTLDRPAGSTIDLDEALERMITISDNSSAVLLTDRVGAYNINQDMRSLGMPHTRVVADDLATSPGDMLAFFEMLANGRGVSTNASAEMVHLLARQRVNDRLPRLLPGEAIVAHKTGNLPGVVNDAGIIYGPNVAFIAVVLVNRTTDEGEAARIASDLTAMAWDYFRQVRAQDPGLASATTRFPAVEPRPTRPPRPPTPVPPTPAPLTATRPPAPTATEAVELPTAVPATATTVPSPVSPATPTAEPTAESDADRLPPTRTPAPVQAPASFPGRPLTPVLPPGFSPRR